MSGKVRSGKAMFGEMCGGAVRAGSSPFRPRFDSGGPQW